jgi:Fe-Mn family superoxide dismutase
LEEKMSDVVSRRAFLAGFALATGGIVAREVGAASPPTEAGLSHEGLLAGRPGFQARTVMRLPYQELPGFLSRDQLESHHAEYVRDVERLKESEERLRDTSLDASRYAEARRAQVLAANSVLLHEFYFANMAPARVDVPRYIDGHLREHMGGMEVWVADFTRCALTARAWAVLVYDPYDDRWHDTMMEGNDTGIWLGANPLIVCDVSEHAFAHDYHHRDDYVAKFVEHIDWNEVAKRYKAVDRM